ncbi:unnamed protein product [Lupinus luteus]|uniref:Reverse transcriptase zinc-binding domain-containing protein n=1 Tax=Lupinus luteus TaxID=3873 RepID=A0AAV1WWS9_LUPLU
MIKLLWNLAAKPNKLWVRWVHTYYLKGSMIEEYQPKTTCSWILKAIQKYRALPKHFWMNSAQQKKFSTKCVYKELRGQQHNISWRKLFYDNLARPRSRFTTWLACQHRLPTKNMLLKFGIHTDGKCIFCGQEETTDHLFLLCPIPATI